MNNRRLLRASIKAGVFAVMLIILCMGVTYTSSTIYAAESVVITDKRVANLRELSHSADSVEIGWDKITGADG